MMAVVDEQCLTDVSSEDSYEELKEIESNLYSIIHHNNLSETVDTDLPEGYKINVDSSTHDLVVTLERTINNCVNRTNEEAKEIGVDSNLVNSMFNFSNRVPKNGENFIQNNIATGFASTVENVNFIRTETVRNNCSSNNVLCNDSDVEIINVPQNGNRFSCVEIPDPGRELICARTGQSQLKLINSALNTTLQASTNDLPPPGDAIVISSSEDDVPKNIVATNSTNRRKRSRLKMKKSRNRLESMCPKKWKPSMVKFYCKISRKKKNFDCNLLLQNMRETVDKSHWWLGSRDLNPAVERRKVRCVRCKQFGHLGRDCSEPRKPIVCLMCGEIGHRESRCQHTKCLTCGRPTPVYVQTCSKCSVYLMKRIFHCKVCNSDYHDEEFCPEVWRICHATTEPGSLVIPIRSRAVTKNCSNCTERGHTESECMDIINSAYMIENSSVKDYFAVAQVVYSNNAMTVILRLEAQDGCTLASESGYEFLQNLSNDTEARLELDVDEPKRTLTVFGTITQCKTVTDKVISFLEKKDVCNKQKNHSNAHKKRRTV